MDYNVWLLLVGAGIGLVSSIVGAAVQHFLSLRTDKIKRERDSLKEEAQKEQEREKEEAKKLREQVTGEAKLIRAASKAIRDLAVIGESLGLPDDFYGAHFDPSEPPKPDVASRARLEHLAGKLRRQRVMRAYMLLYEVMKEKDPWRQERWVIQQQRERIRDLEAQDESSD